MVEPFFRDFLDSSSSEVCNRSLEYLDELSVFRGNDLLRDQFDGSVLFTLPGKRIYAIANFLRERDAIPSIEIE